MYWTAHLFNAPLHKDPAAVAIGTNIFTFGGNSGNERFKPIDIHVLDTVKLKWLKLELVEDQDCNCVPFQRYGYTAVAQGSKIYLWGGHNENRTCNTLYCFDTGTLKWSTPNVRGNIPVSRYGHSACVIRNGMYIFGGLQEHPSRFAQDLYLLDLGSMVWSIVKTKGTTPAYKDFHTATAIDNKMYIYGALRGTNTEMGVPQIYYLDTVTSTWVCPTVNGFKPAGRCGHSAFVHNGFLYIYGGSAKHFNSFIQDIYLQDLNRYDPESSTWMRLLPKGSTPCPRSGQICQIINDRVFISGGTSPLSCESAVYFPSLIYDPNKLIFNPLRALNDLHVLDLNSSLKNMCLANLSKYIGEYDISIEDLHIPLSLKNDLAAVYPFERRNKENRIMLSLSKYIDD